MYQYSGTCNCGKVVIEFSSPRKISRYTSRKCDCVYCLARGIEYLSDPQGQIIFISKDPLDYEKQGSEQATFLLCSNCQTLVGVCYVNKDISVGSLNARILDKFEHLQGSVNVSLKKLSDIEKLGRWSDLWSQVRMVEG